MTRRVGGTGWCFNGGFGLGELLFVVLKTRLALITVTLEALPAGSGLNFLEFDYLCKLTAFWPKKLELGCFY